MVNIQIACSIEYNFSIVIQEIEKHINKLKKVYLQFVLKKRKLILLQNQY